MADETKKEFLGFGDLKVLEISPLEDLPIYVNVNALS
jgi:hypothetical protein